MRAKRCPVCRKSLTDAEYQRAPGSLDAREKHLEHELGAAKQQAKVVHVAGVRAERAKTQRLLAGKERVIEVQFVESRQFDNPIAEIVHVATELQAMVYDEARQHKRTWERRWERYQTIQWDGEHIRQSLQALSRLPA